VDGLEKIEHFVTGSSPYILPLIVSKSYFTNLEELDIFFNFIVTSSQLKSALKALSSSVKTLFLTNLDCSFIVEAFEGITFGKLERLNLTGLFPDD
jgi:hypothetical protein